MRAADDTRRQAAVLAAAVVLLGALVLLVTGLFTPGWMLVGAERSKPLAPPPAATSAPQINPPAQRVNAAQTAGIEKFARRYLTAYNDRDVPELAELACRPPTETQRIALLRTLVLRKETAARSGPAEVDGDAATVPVTLRSTASGKPVTETSSVTATRHGHGWCAGPG